MPLSCRGFRSRFNTVLMFNIRNRLLISIGAVVVLGVIGIEAVGFLGLSALGIEGAQQRFRADALRRIDKLADERASRLESWLAERHQDLDTIGENPAVSVLATRLAHYIADARRHGELSPDFWKRYQSTAEYRSLSRQVRSIRGSRPDTYAVVGIRDAESGFILASSRGDGPIGTPTLRGNAQFERSRTPGQLKYVDLFVSPIDQVRYLRMTQQIFSRDADGNPAELVAVAQFLLPFRALPIAPGSDAYETEDAYLVGEGGVPLTRPRFFAAGQGGAGSDAPMLHDRAASLASSGSGGLMRDIDYRGKAVLVAFRNIAVSPDIGWGLVVKQDEDEALRPLHDDILNRVKLTALWSLAILLLVWWLARQLAAPIAKLASVAEALERGQLSARVDLERSDEIGVLARTFDGMAARMESWHRSLSDEVSARTHQLQRVNRLYRTLSETNQAMLRESDRARFLEHVCAIIVEHGGFDAAWITIPAENGEPIRFSRWRDDHFRPDIDAIEAPCRDGECLPPTEATVVVGEIATDDRVAPCRSRMLELGWHSFVAVPIRSKDGVCGSLRIAARESGAVDAQSVALLEELASDVGYAIRTIQGESRRLLAEATVAVQEARLSAILTSTVDAVISMDSYGLVEYWNPAAEALFGYRAAEVVGQNLHALVLPGALREKAATGFATFARTGDGPILGRTIEVVARHRSGDALPVELAVAAFRKGDAWHAVGIVRDIRERKRVETELTRHREHLEILVAERTKQADDRAHSLADALDRLQRVQRQLIQAEKLSGLGALVAGVAHELNTPIGNAHLVASSMVEVADKFEARLNRNEGLRRSELAEFARRTREGQQLVERNLVRASEIIQSFKQVAVDQASSNRRLFDLKTVVEEVLLTVRPGFRRSPIELVSELPAEVAIDGYPGPLGQVIVNLLDNARVHGFPGRGHGRVRVFAEALAGDRFEMRIEDDGVGIPERNLPRIFDPFFTTRLGQGGSGLGLSIVYNIVTGLLGGTIEVRSQAAAGTTFVMTFPLKAPESSGPADELALCDELRGKPQAGVSRVPSGDDDEV